MMSSIMDTTTTKPSNTLKLSATYPRGFSPITFTTISKAKYVVTT